KRLYPPQPLEVASENASAAAAPRDPPDPSARRAREPRPLERRSRAAVPERFLQPPQPPGAEAHRKRVADADLSRGAVPVFLERRQHLQFPKEDPSKSGGPIDESGKGRHGCYRRTRGATPETQSPADGGRRGRGNRPGLRPGATSPA